MSEGVHHYWIVGTSGQGKSVLLQAEARRLGISYEELLRRMEPTAEQKERARMQEEDEQRAEAARLEAVREAFWNRTPPVRADFNHLHDVLVIAEIVEEPTPSQVKALFMMLPPDIFGSAIAWGFFDTEVRERTYEFVERSRADVVRHVTAAAT